MTDNTLTVRDHTQPCEHGMKDGHTTEWWDGTNWIKCPGGREIVFEKWNDWCWAHDKEPNFTGGTCIFQGYRGDCDIRPMYELVEVEHG